MDNHKDRQVDKYSLVESELCHKDHRDHREGSHNFRSRGHQICHEHRDLSHFVGASGEKAHPFLNGILIRWGVKVRGDIFWIYPPRMLVGSSPPGS